MVSTATTSEPSILALEKGDIAFILNGARNSAFKATVTMVGSDWIIVHNEAKGEDQKFSLPDGEALADIEFKTGSPLLVHAQDWRAQFLIARTQFRRLHVYLQERAAEFARFPSNVNAQSVLAATNAFTSFSTRHDPITLTAASVHEYLEMTAYGYDAWLEKNRAAS